MTSVLCVGKGNKLQDYATSNKSYELAFGYLVNLSKTEVNYAANMQLKVEAHHLQILWNSADKSPLQALGLHHVLGLKAKMFDVLVDRL